MAGDAVLDHLHAAHDHILARLVSFAGIPSISTDPTHASDIARAAQWVAGEVAAAGPFTVRTLPTGGHPVVYAEWLGAPGQPTVLVYGHYDVQPPDPLDKWVSPPFTPTVRDGRLYARGVSDDKAPMLIPFASCNICFKGSVVISINCSGAVIPFFIRSTRLVPPAINCEEAFLVLASMAALAEVAFM